MAKLKLDKNTLKNVAKNTYTGTVIDKLLPKVGEGYDQLVGNKARAAAKSKDAEAAAKQAQAEATWEGLIPPAQQNVISDKVKNVGAYSTQNLQDLANLSYSEGPLAQAQAALAGPSAFKDINVDPRLMKEQYGSLDALSQIADSGGMTAMDKANLARTQSQANQNDKGRRDAILQNMAARGMSGSGNELLAQLQSSQASTDRQSQAGLDTAGMAQQRALDAIMQRGNLAGGMQSQQFGQEAQKAQAADAIAKFNAGNTQQTTLFNTGATNDQIARKAAGTMDAGKYNQGRTMGVNTYNTDLMNKKFQDDASRAQNLETANTGLRNQDRMYNSQAGQRDFENRSSIAAGKTGQYNRAADNATARANQESAAGAGMLNALISGGAAAGAAYAGGGKK